LRCSGADCKSRKMALVQRDNRGDFPRDVTSEGEPKYLINKRYFALIILWSLVRSQHGLPDLLGIFGLVPVWCHPDIVR
jgi:hypothetical protein